MYIIVIVVLVFNCLSKVGINNLEHTTGEEEAASVLQMINREDSRDCVVCSGSVGELQHVNDTLLHEVQAAARRTFELFNALAHKLMMMPLVPVYFV
jgi:hypothetical protein